MWVTRPCFSAGSLLANRWRGRQGNRGNAALTLPERLHIEIDKAVAAAHGWEDLDLGNGLHATPHGTRFTLSEAARREVLARLLRLNHERQ